MYVIWEKAFLRFAAAMTAEEISLGCSGKKVIRIATHVIFTIYHGRLCCWCRIRVGRIGYFCSFLAVVPSRERSLLF